MKVNSDEHIRHALEAAQQSIVLLKNADHVLPLAKGKHVAVIGPHFNGTEVFLSNYHGSKCLNSTGGISPGPDEWGCITNPLQVRAQRFCQRF
jgi:beta-glucosidase